MEVAKDLILTGVGEVCIADSGTLTHWDLGSHFFAQEADVGRPRASAAIVEQLQGLNTACRVQCADLAALTPDAVAERFHVVICCDPEGAAVQQVTELNRATRERGVRLVLAEARGLYARVFCDFGPSHTVSDPDGRDPERHVVVGADPDGASVVISVDDPEDLGLWAGARVRLERLELEGGLQPPPADYRVRELLGRGRLRLEGPWPPQGRYLRGGYLLQLKEVAAVAFRSLADSAARPEFLSDGVGDPQELHCAFAALHSHAAAAGGIPDPRNGEAAAAVGAAARAAGGSAGAAECAARLAASARASLAPVVTFIGAVAAQEALKAVTGKYTPIVQWYYYDGSAAAPPPEQLAPAGVAEAPTGRYASQLAVFGPRLHKKIMDLRYFTVGCGALGCELLKGFALMGLGAGPRGFVTVTDPDKIERSNLSRQFLFRSQHVGDFKSRVAADAAKRINPKLKVKAMTHKACPETEDVFNARFWERLDCAVNALDNVKARQYVDSQCVAHRRPLLESGTLGPQAHTQVILPGRTENYGRQADPDTGDIPQCTLHYFPSTIEHTIAFARDWFAGAFERPASDASAFLRDPRQWREAAEAAPPAGRAEAVGAVHRALVAQRPVDLPGCVRWARHSFEQLFCIMVRELLHWHPLDKRDEGGQLFWKGKLRPPAPLRFDASDPEHRGFVLLGARLRAEVYGIDHRPLQDEALALRLISEAERDLPCFVPPAPDAAPPPPPDGGAAQAPAAAPAAPAADAPAVREAMADLARLEANPEQLACIRVLPMEFEKDDPGNGHVAFITCCSNLRARCYNIPTLDVLQTKRIAGRILPAMITTTALITGLVCVEIYKLHALQQLPVESFRNAWVNLAVPFLLQSEPLPPVARPYLAVSDDEDPAAGGASPPPDFSGHPLEGKTWTVWDRMEVPSKGDATLGQLFEGVLQRYGLEVSQLSTLSGQLVWCEFASPALFRELAAGQPVLGLLQKLTGREQGPSVDFVVRAKARGRFLRELPLLRYTVR
eukprot:TRINITY_DN9120_c0_g1_i8.p1 TRINITY_DN9120_c0_g1~~TRINITY_DN9120_c0_g1_i8.p1  ORF type:complete len:1139 (+),score=389.69 TRINITY_DN9120_c0_g1_i8:383-3418(+)